MFEKEAEEYVCGLFPSVNVFARGRLIQAFKDGAKFGYNKAAVVHGVILALVIIIARRLGWL